MPIGDRLTQSSPALDAPALAAPAASRFDAIDVLRGFAVLGILAMNITVFAQPMAAYMNPSIIFPYQGIDRAGYWFTHIVFDLKMMTIFSMLFGAGVAMYATKIERGASVSSVRWAWLRRCAWLLAIGMVHAYIIWEGDILVSYSILGLLVLWWVRRLPNWALLSIASVLLVVSAVISLLLGSWFFINTHPDIAINNWNMPPETVQQMSEGFDEAMKDMAPTPERIEELNAIYLADWYTLFKHRAATTFGFQMFMLPMFGPRLAAVMMIGIVLFRTRVISAARSTRFYITSAAIGYAVGLPLVIAGIRYNESHGFDIGYLMFTGAQFNYWGSLAVAYAHVAAVMLIVRSGILRPIVRGLQAAGRMAFTNYLSQSILCSLIFYGFGLGLFGRYSHAELLLFVLGIWNVQVLFSVFWLSRFRFGPAEWAWRSLSYWKLQPMRRTPGGSAAD